MALNRPARIESQLMHMGRLGKATYHGATVFHQADTTFPVCGDELY